jgi:predicted alpha/beta hydrolase family esterase
MITVWSIPGLYDSGPAHWQRHWQRDHGARVVEQRDWETPQREEWVRTIEAAIGASSGPIALTGHSLGCATIAWWAASTRHAARVRGALLVAPSDVEAPTFPPGPAGFGPMPLAPLPFPSRVVASTDDPYATLDRARRFATAWRSDMTILADAGHLNSASGLGAWSEGYALLAPWLEEDGSPERAEDLRREAQVILPE